MTDFFSETDICYFGPILTYTSYIEGGQFPAELYGAEGSSYQVEPVLLTVGDVYTHNVAIVPLNTVVIGSSFVSYPANLAPYHLAADYGDLGQTLAELKDSTDDECQIDEPVYDIATQVASSLMAHFYPAPKVFSHGPKSVVFNWEASDDRSLYLTISKDYVSGLLSSPSKIERRVQVPVAMLIKGSLLRPFVEWTKHGRPVVSSGGLLETAAI